MTTELRAKKSAVVGAGVDIGSGAIANVTIQGVVYPVCWDVALGPNTDWSRTIPAVEILHRDVVGWDIGCICSRKCFTEREIESTTSLTHCKLMCTMP